MKSVAVALVVFALGSSLLPVSSQQAQAGEVSGVRSSGDGSGKDGAVVVGETAKGRDPADFGRREDGALWQDAVVEAVDYVVEVGQVVTTHTHGVVVYAQGSITIRGRLDVHGLGSRDGDPTRPTSRVAQLHILDAHGDPDPSGVEPWLYGDAGTTDCPGTGGGYVILRAPTIQIDGTIDASGDGCGQGGTVYLEGTVAGSGTVRAGLVVRRA